jgi:hypothetical protein
MHPFLCHIHVCRRGTMQEVFVAFVKSEVCVCVCARA